METQRCRPSRVAIPVRVCSRVRVENYFAADYREGSAAAQVPSDERRITALRQESLRIDAPRERRIDHRDITNGALRKSATWQIESACRLCTHALDHLGQRENVVLDDVGKNQADACLE